MSTAVMAASGESMSVSANTTTALTHSHGQQPTAGSSKVTNSALEAMERRWNKIAGMESDLLVTINDVQFNVHKFPLYSKSDRLREIAKDEPRTGRTTADLAGLPGGDRIFVQVVNYCYGFDIDVSPYNVAALRCAAEFLQMHDDSQSGMREGNLVPLTERALVKFFADWKDTISILHHCQRLMPAASDCGLVDRCMLELCKLCVLFSSSSSSSSSSVLSTATDSSPSKVRPNRSATPAEGIHLSESVLSLDLDFYADLIAALRRAGMPAQEIGRSIDAYARYWIPEVSDDFEHSRRNRRIVETLVSLLPVSEGEPATIVDVFSKPDALIRLLRAAKSCDAEEECRRQLIATAGVLLDQADVEDLTHLEMHEVQALAQVHASRAGLTGSADLSPTNHQKVAKVLDEYLELACSCRSPSANPNIANNSLNWQTIKSLASSVPAEARSNHDTLFRALLSFITLKKGTLSEKGLLSLFEVVDPSKLSHELTDEVATHHSLPPTFVARALIAQKDNMRKSITDLANRTKSLEEERRKLEQEKVEISADIEQLRREVQLANDVLQQTRRSLRGGTASIFEKNVVLQARVKEMSEEMEELEIKNKSLKEREEEKKERVQSRRKRSSP
ncbi:hypothetical protein CBR_g54941 [Chara braunii]|uniref:BTB domain-containing protein n=1 Tax=Chara braunii TaxID=69332 RepID=A0A388K7D4_CHABU|nr:hypothetical protein CBR_g54941 [Chara braunii]|eukprot:GBG65962.1 hypothetical protein CBR_g54941 [Chara braunii]